MVAKKLKLAGKEFVILSKRDYVALKDRANGVATKRPARAKPKMTDQDWGDVAEAKRRLADPTDRDISLAELKRELGL